MEDYGSQFQAPAKADEDLELGEVKKKKGFLSRLFGHKAPIAPPPPPISPQDNKSETKNDQEIDKLKERLGIQDGIEDTSSGVDKKMLENILNKIQDINDEDKIELEQVKKEKDSPKIKEEKISAVQEVQEELPELPPDLDFDESLIDNIDKNMENLKIEVKDKSSSAKKEKDPVFMKSLDTAPAPALTKKQTPIPKINTPKPTSIKKTASAKKTAKRKTPIVTAPVELASEKKVPADEAFISQDGTRIHSLVELFEELCEMSTSTFKHHITDERNDFAQWIQDIFENKNLADKVRKEKTKDKITKIIRSYIEKEEREAIKMLKDDEREFKIEKKKLSEEQTVARYEEDVQRLKLEKEHLMAEIQKEKEHIITQKQEILKQYMDLKNDTTRYKLAMKNDLHAIHSKREEEERIKREMEQHKRQIEKDLLLMQRQAEQVRKEQENDILKHQKEVQKAQRELEASRDQVQKNTNIINTQEKLIDTLKASISKLEKKKEEILNDMHKLEPQVKEAVQRLEILEATLNRRQKDIDEAEEALQQRKSHILHLKHELENKGYKTMLKETLDETSDVRGDEFIDPQQRDNIQQNTRLLHLIEQCSKYAATRNWQKAQALYNEIRDIFYKEQYSSKEEKQRIYNQIRLLYDEIHLAMIGQKSIV